MFTFRFYSIMRFSWFINNYVLEFRLLKEILMGFFHISLFQLFESPFLVLTLCFKKLLDFLEFILTALRNFFRDFVLHKTLIAYSDTYFQFLLDFTFAIFLKDFRKYIIQLKNALISTLPFLSFRVRLK